MLSVREEVNGHGLDWLERGPDHLLRLASAKTGQGEFGRISLDMSKRMLRGEELVRCSIVDQGALIARDVNEALQATAATNGSQGLGMKAWKE